MANLAEDLFEDAGLPLAATWLGVSATYTALPAQPGGAITSTAVTVYLQHLPDMSPVTQGPYQQRKFYLPVSEGITPKRADYITLDGLDWVVKDIERVRGERWPLQTRIAQEDV